jgi:protein TonB
LTINETAAAATTTTAPRNNQKRTAILVTGDDALWPLVGAVMARDVVLKQMDSVEHLLSEADPEQAGVVIWDTRGDGDTTAQLESIRQRLTRMAVMVLDVPAKNAHWKRLADQNQIVAVVPLPFAADSFVPALDLAFDEMRMRRAVLGDSAKTAPPPGTPAKSSSKHLALGVGLGVVALAAVIAYFVLGSKPPAGPVSEPAPERAAAAVAVPAGTSSEQVDSLLEKAAQAMLERRYIEPADNNALGFYRNVLGNDPDNAEATQGLARLAQLLLTKAETALDQRRFEPALQALEIARSISRDDPRVKSLDARLLQLRSELGSSAILASINAGNYDRANMQIDEAARNKSLTADQLAQLRDDLRRQHDSEIERLAKLAQARAQQERAAQEARLAAQHNQEAQIKAERQRLINLFDERLAQGKLTEPANDSATYYLDSLVAADPQNPALANMSRALQEKSATHSAAPQPAKATVAQDSVLKLLKPIRPAYPFGARISGKEGWVDLVFTVAPDGRVGNLRVADASPKGLFEQAAMSAMGAARYEPVPKNQPQVNRDAKVRLKFQMDKE